MNTGPRPLHLCLVAPLWACIPPRTYGGIERHLDLLISELARLGHQVTLFATGDSCTPAELRSLESAAAHRRTSWADDMAAGSAGAAGEGVLGRLRHARIATSSSWHISAAATIVGRLLGHCGVVHA